MEDIIESVKDKFPSSLIPKLPSLKILGIYGNELIYELSNYGELGALFLEQVLGDIPDIPTPELNQEVIQEKLEQWFKDIFSVEPSPYDSNDKQYERDVLPSLNKISTSSILDLRYRLLRPRNQGSRGTCAAFTGATIKESQEFIDTGLKVYYSPEFIYWHRSTKPNAGMYGRNVMKVLVEHGTCPELVLPYQNKDVNSISEDIRDKASGYKCLEFSKINTIDGLKKALNENGACYISVPVYSSHSPEIWRKTPNEPSRGGHAMTVVGYTKSGFIIQNSWGDSWNGDGCVIYPYSDFKENMHWEIWTITDKEGSPKPDQPVQPKCKCIVM